MPERGPILAGLAAEVSFAVLPLIVVLMVCVHQEKTSNFLASPEWSFGASILFGQTLVRFVSGLTRSAHAATGPVALAVALLVVFAIVPSLIVLTLTLLSDEACHVAAWLRVSQVVLFAGSAVIYLLLGAVGEIWRLRAAD